MGLFIYILSNNTTRLLTDFQSLKKLIEKQQNIAKILIMDTDSMDKTGFC